MNTVLINAIRRQNKEPDYILKQAVVGRAEASRKLRKHLKSSQIKVILGPRRAGKSTLALKALEGTNVAFVNLEDEAVLGAISENDELMEVLDKLNPEAEYYLLDEIQNLPNWETFLNRQHRRGKNLIVTGSNSKLLSKELATSLTGRHIAIELYPFSFEEFVSAKKSSAATLEMFDEWMTDGGFPEVSLGRSEAGLYLKTLFDAIILRDVVNRHRIRNSVAIQSLAQLLIKSISSRFTARSLERALSQVSFVTIQKYLGYLQEAYLFFELQAFSHKARQRVASERKIYTVDNGFVSACTDKSRSQKGQLLENLVFVELLRRGYVPNLSLFYAQTSGAQTSGSREVDFFIPAQRGRSKLIQVCYDLSSPLTIQRELRGIVQAAREFNVKDCIIVTRSDEASFNEGGIDIQAVPAVRWLESPDG